MENIINSKIWQKNIRKNYNLIKFNKKIDKYIFPKYYPAYFKEWKNTVYLYNKKNLQNFPIINLNINHIISHYFFLFFKNNKFINSKYINRKRTRFLLKKIYINNSYIKHTNSKAIISLNILNIGKKTLIRKNKSLITILTKNIIRQSQLYFFIKALPTILNKKIELKNLDLNRILMPIYYYYLLKKFYLISQISRKLQYMYFLNQFKLNNKFFLSKLGHKLSKIFGKKVEFNILNLNSITHNPEIFTKVLTLKIRKKRNANIIKIMKTIFNKGKLPNTNRFLETKKFDKTLTKNYIENKYKNNNLINIFRLKNELNLRSNNINNNTDLLKKFYNDIYNNFSYRNLRNKNNTIFDSIKHKNLGGMKLEIKGRLTKRYRADKSIYKFYLKGSLNNLDSSLKRLPSTIFRGHLNNNLAYSMQKSKRRIGAFAVKGWITGK